MVFFLGYILDYKRGTLSIDNNHAKTKNREREQTPNWKSLRELHWCYHYCDIAHTDNDNWQLDLLLSHLT